MTATRDRYLDLLRAIAIARVVVFHMFGFAWLSYLFPAMGVMFALGGSLMAASLRRSVGRAVRSRIRRLVPALWAMGAVLVPAMAWHATAHPDDGPVPWSRLVLWLLPLAEPPGTAWARPVTQVLWYLSTYLWLVLLSPLAWKAFQRWPVATVLAPLPVLAATQLGPVSFDGPAGSTVVNVATFAACWFVGFAHRAGHLRRLDRRWLGGLAVAGMVAGAAWAVTHPAEGGVDLNDIPLAQAAYSLGAVLLVLRAAPGMGWLAGSRIADGTVTLLNGRAVTIYLWHNAAIALSFPVGDVLQVWAFGGWRADLGYFGVALVLLAAVVAAAGWVEDLAARRRPVLLPVGSRAAAPAAAPEAQARPAEREGPAGPAARSAVVGVQQRRHVEPAHGEHGPGDPLDPHRIGVGE